MARSKYAKFYDNWVELHVQEEMTPDEIAASCPSGAHRNTIYQTLVREDVWQSERPELRKPRRPLEERFWEKVDASGDCWEWEGYIDTNGQGRLSSMVADRGVSVMAYAPRIAYKLDTGTDPGDFVVRHRCDNSICCRPSHLYLSKNGMQFNDFWKTSEKSRSEYMPKGEDAAAAKFDNEEVRQMREKYWYHSEVTQKDISNEYEIASSTTSKILRGLRYPGAGGPTS